MKGEEQSLFWDNVFQMHTWTRHGNTVKTIMQQFHQIILFNFVYLFVSIFLLQWIFYLWFSFNLAGKQIFLKSIKQNVFQLDLNIFFSFFCFSKTFMKTITPKMVKKHLNPMDGSFLENHFTVPFHSLVPMHAHTYNTYEHGTQNTHYTLLLIYTYVFHPTPHVYMVCRAHDHLMLDDK